jgi:prepilin-type N-terminal cleavage/methylation domain-containing protein
MSTRGFSLLELMIVVSITGILAAIAYPRFLYAENRARRAEVDVVLSQVKQIQYTWFGAFGCFVSIRRTPEGGGVPNGQRRSWVSSRTGGGSYCEDEFGFADTDMRQPGTVYFFYECETRGSPADYTCSAVGDLDEDGALGEYVYCSDFSGTGAGCTPSASGATSLFPFEVVRVSPQPW